VVLIGGVSFQGRKKGKGIGGAESEPRELFPQTARPSGQRGKKKKKGGIRFLRVYSIAETKTKKTDYDGFQQTVRSRPLWFFLPGKPGGMA